jgi:hypothetical protein
VQSDVPTAPVHLNDYGLFRLSVENAQPLRLSERAARLTGYPVAEPVLEIGFSPQRSLIRITPPSPEHLTEQGRAR